MFQTINECLNEMLCYLAIGFALAILYEPLRLSRILIKTNVVVTAIEDIAYFVLCGLVCFAYSVMLCNGIMRIYCFIAAFVGATAYFFTLGRITALLLRKLARAINKLRKVISTHIFTPVRKAFVTFAHKTGAWFRQCYDFSKKIDLGSKKRLKKQTEIGYNNSVPLKTKEGARTNVIKARVREKT